VLPLVSTDLQQLLAQSRWREPTLCESLHWLHTL
jgi:hypothetical protein